MIEMLNSTVLAAATSNIPPFNASSIGALESQIPGYKFGGANLNYLISLQDYGIVNIIFFVAGVALIINLILAGIGLMTSAGDPSKIKAGQTRIINGLLGMLLTLSAYFIIRLVGTILNLPGITATF
jgi:hypothetical protein